MEGWKGLDRVNFWLDLPVAGLMESKSVSGALHSRKGRCGHTHSTSDDAAPQCPHKRLAHRHHHHRRRGSFPFFRRHLRKPGILSRRLLRRRSFPFFRRLHHLRRGLLRSNQHRLEANHIHGRLQ